MLFGSLAAARAQVIGGPLRSLPGQWSKFAFTDGVAGHSTWPPTYFWRLTGVDSVAGIARSQWLDAECVSTASPEILVRWAPRTTTGLVEVRDGEPQESKLLADHVVQLSLKGSSIIIVGPDTLEGGQTVKAEYAAKEVSGWSEEYYWHVEGADSVAGVSRAELLINGDFRTPQPTCTIFWNATDSTGSIELRVGRAEQPDETVGYLTVARIGCPSRYRILADWASNGSSQSARTVRSGSFVLCPNDRYVLGVSMRNGRQYWKITYYTEYGEQYQEAWTEINPMGRTGTPAPNFYMKCYEEVPCISGPLTTFPFDNRSFQPHFTRDPSVSGPGVGPFFCGGGLGRGRITSALIESTTSGALSGLLCRNNTRLSTQIKVYYGVGSAGSVSLNTSGPLCPNQSYTATTGNAQYATGYEWEFSYSGVYSHSLVTTSPSVGIFISANSAGQQLRVRVRPFKGSGPNSVNPELCEWIGEWVSTGDYTINAVPAAPVSINFVSAPVVLNQPATLRVNGGSGPDFRWTASGPNGGLIFIDPITLTPTNTITATGGIRTVEARFPAVGTYTISVRSINPGLTCGIGTPLTTTFTIDPNQVVTCPSARFTPSGCTYFSPYTGGPYAFDNVPHPTANPINWFELTNGFNPTLSYFLTPPIVRPSGSRPVYAAQNPGTPGKWVFHFDRNQSLPNPTSIQFDLYVTNQTGTSIRLCSYNYNVVQCRPGQSGIDGDNVLLDEARVMLIPNPADDATARVRVEVPGQVCERAELYDVRGQLLQTAAATEHGATAPHFDLSQVAAGVYVVKAYSAGQVLTHRLVRQ